MRIAHLSKSFKLPHQRYSTLKERMLHPFRSTTYDVLEAVKDVSVEIGEGEFFGIVGRNGSGKSTLLKCLAGIYRTDRGEAEVRGRLSPFIELGVGFNPDLTARENVTINAIMLGLSPQARPRSASTRSSPSPSWRSSSTSSSRTTRRGCTSGSRSRWPCRSTRTCC